MAAKAYILIETAIGKTGKVLADIRAVKGVSSADAVTGPYDVVAIINGADANEIGKVVMNNIHGIDGVSRTLTCLSVESAS